MIDQVVEEMIKLVDLMHLYFRRVGACDYQQETKDLGIRLKKLQDDLK